VHHRFTGEPGTIPVGREQAIGRKACRRDVDPPSGEPGANALFHAAQSGSAIRNNIMSGMHYRAMGERRQRSGRRSRDNPQIASERIVILFREAERAAGEGEHGLSERYVSLARSIGMRYNVRLPARLKRRVCKKCGALLLPGKNLRVRLRSGKTVRTCLKCGNVSRLLNAPRTTNAAQSIREAAGRGKKTGLPVSRQSGEPGGEPVNRRAGDGPPRRLSG